MATVATAPLASVMPSRSHTRAPIILFAITVVSCIYQLTRFPLPGFGAYYEALTLAKNLAYTGRFADPFSAGATGPTAHLAPLVPALLAILIRLLGYGVNFVLVTEGLMVAALALQAALLPAISERLFGSRRPGIWAGALA